MFILVSRITSNFKRTIHQIPIVCDMLCKYFDLKASQFLFGFSVEKINETWIKLY